MQARDLESSEEVDLVKAIIKGSVSADILPIQIAYCLYSNWHAKIKEGSRFRVSLNMRVAQTTSQPTVFTETAIYMLCMAPGTSRMLN